MPTITNNGKQTPLGIASGFTIAPGASRRVPASLWARVSQGAVVKGWLRSGKLSVAEGEEAEPDERTDEEREQDDLIAKLAEYDIHKTRRTSLESLRSQLAKAEADANGGA